MASTPSRDGSAKAGSQKSKTTRAATPWGPASVVERLSVPQRVGEKRFAPLVELLETRDGERLVRFAYSTDGVGRRGPITLRARDVERLHKELARAPELAALLGGAFGSRAVGSRAVGGRAFGGGA